VVVFSALVVVLSALVPILSAAVLSALSPLIAVPEISDPL
jgi:hypothetical protein